MKKLLLLMLICFNLHAETIEFVVSATPGGGDDLATRKIIVELESRSNLKFIVSNRPGASKTIGYNYVYSTDKPTLMLSSDSILDHKVRDVVEPLFYVGYSSNMVITGSASGIQNINDLILLSQKREIRVGHGGELTQGYVGGKAVCEKLKLDCLYVPYKSGPDVIMGLISNTVDIFATVSFGAENYIKNNKNIIPLLLMSTTKHKLFDVPILPNKYKEIEQKKWTILFSKNLRDSDKETIHSILKSLDDDFFINQGFWYSYKDVKKEFK